MRRQTWILALAVALAAALPALAGDEKCSYSTQECLNHYALKMKTGGWVGVDLDKSESGEGYVVKKVIEGSPAMAAGIKPGDILFALNGVVISKKNEEALKAARAEWKPGQKVNYTIKRGGADKDISLTLAPMPADLLARIVGEHMLQHASVEAPKDVSKN